jgi:hypothetical protein
MQATAYFLQFGAVCHAIGVERDYLLVFRYRFLQIALLLIDETEQ